MDKQKLISKTAEEAEPQEIKEVSDESLEKVSGGAQPKPKEPCPLDPKNFAPHL